MNAETAADKEKPDAGEGLDTPSGALPLAQAIGTRNLIIIIITMPLVFIIVVMATLMIFGRPGDREQSANPDAVRSVPLAQTLDSLEQPGAPAHAPTLAGGAPLALPAGASIGAMALDGDRLAVRLDGPGGGEIVIYDLARGEEIRRIRVLAGDEGL